MIREIPQASLAAILVYTGYKLASPKVFHAAWLKGWEQLLIMVTTLIASLALDLLWGIMIGILSTLLIHWFRSGLSFQTFIKHLFNTEINVLEESKDVVHVDIKGIANFAIMLRLINSLKLLKEDKHFVVNFSRTKLVDSTVMDFIHDHRERYFTKSDFEFVGLDVHKTSSPHPLALHVLERPMQKRMTTRQNAILHFGNENNYRFKPEINWEVAHFEDFQFFDSHFLEFQRNRLMGTFDNGINWMISDINYNDGILMAREEHHISAMVLNLKDDISDFCITKENIRQLKAMVKGKENHTSDELDPMSKLLIDNASYYVEGVGNQILIYRKTRLLSTREIVDMHDFAKALFPTLPKAD